MSHSATHATVSIKDLEALMLAAACVRGVYSAVESHKNDAAVMRTRTDVEMAISNASKMISDARRIKDPMEDEAATESELDILKTFCITWDGPAYDLAPNDPAAVSILRKRLAVMGHMTATIHWGDKTTENRSHDKLLWKLTAKGEKAVNAAGLYISPQID